MDRFTKKDLTALKTFIENGMNTQKVLELWMENTGLVWKTSFH